MKKILFLMSISAGLLFALSPSSNAGTTAFPFLLENDVGTSGSALGGAYVGWSKSADGFMFNPASSAFRRKRSVIASFGNFWGLFNAGFTAYSQKIDDKNSVSAGANIVSYGNFTRTDDEGNETGDFSGSDFEFIASYSRRLNKNFAVGANGKLLYSSIDTFSSSAMALDIGVMYRDRRDDARAGLVLSNLGAMLSAYGTDKPSLPWAVKLGGYYDLPGFPGEIGAQIETAADVDFCARVGIEFDFLKPLFFRIGYVYRPKPSEDPSNSEQLNGLTAGAGINYKKFTFGYSIQNYGVLGFVHRAEIGYTSF